MSGIYFPDDPAGVFQSMELPNFGITWAGANPFGEGFCFGSDSGHLAMTDLGGIPASFLGKGSESGEAVNGVAFSQNWLALTTRKDINFIGPWLNASPPQHGMVIFGGARDVIVAPRSGYFIIPLGPDGIMFVKPGAEENDPVTISRSEKANLNFCRALALPGEGGNDLVVCAGRRGGLGYASFREGIQGHALNTVRFDDLDLVDVCSLGIPDKPFAVAAAGKDGSLVFFNDILNDKNPQIMKFKGVIGTVYRVLSAQGDIYLLTSKGLFGLFKLAARFLKGAMLHHFITEILKFPLPAADANMVNRKWLLAVGVDHVFKFDTEKIPKSSEQASSDKEGNLAKENADGSVWEEPEKGRALPLWEESIFEQKYEKMATAV